MRMSNKKKLFYRLIEKVFAFFTDTIICVSNYEKESALQNHICKTNKLQVILNGVDIEEIEKKIAASKLTRDSLNIPEKAYVVGMVGRISEQKAPDVFVKAARKIKDAIPESFFIIVGDGPDQDQIKKMIDDLGLNDSFLITGWTKHAIEYLALFDVAVLCSRWEGLPLVVPEYFAAKKPVVCTKIDAVDDMIEDGVNGCVVGIYDVDAIEKAVVHMYEDASFVINLSETAVNIVRNKFDLAGATRKFTELINVIVN